VRGSKKAVIPSRVEESLVGNAAHRVFGYRRKR
jgi:hypothetical protein